MWPEPERWHATVCNFLQLLAYEKNVLHSHRLFPTARLQVVAELFLGEWQTRTQRLGEKLWPLYFPEAAADGAPGPSAAGAAGGEGLSEYERMRNAQILENQQKLVELGIMDE